MLLNLPAAIRISLTHAWAPEHWPAAMIFAEMARMLNPEPAVFIPGKYDTNGKWMDGWESRRKRVNGHDWCVLKLGRAGILKGVDIDTSHFTGNYPPAAAIEGAFLASGEPDDQTVWQEVLPSVNLQGNSHHYHEISSTQVLHTCA
jgi:allantoicase